jgi:hypothetical protein
MSSITCIAALLLFTATTPPPLVPPDALPEAVQAHPVSAPPPRWLEQALAVWGGPGIARPSLYDYRYITW